MESFEMLKLVDNGKNTSIKQFPRFQNRVTSAEDPECLVSPTNKTHENVTLATELILQNRRNKISEF